MVEVFRDFKVYITDFTDFADVKQTICFERTDTQAGINQIARQLSMGFPAPDYKILVYQSQWDGNMWDWVLIN